MERVSCGLASLYVRTLVSNQRPYRAIDGHEIQAGNGAALADLASLSLEFTRLSQLTGDSKYYDAIARITDALDQAQGGTNLPGMWPSVIDAAGLGFYADGFSLGALSDSAYEYLPKVFSITEYFDLHLISYKGIPTSWRPRACNTVPTHVRGRDQNNKRTRPVATHDTQQY